ncbi:MAG: hypothetical protein LBP64_02225 [Tannerella sp.]|jgi:hypothetical protein|nr:hypothetical protein [Tannerella sp.]
MKTKLVILPLILLLAGLHGCIKEIRTVVVPSGRTVLVYMIASNLGNMMDNNIADMIHSATSDNLNGGNLVVFYSKNQREAELFEIKEGAGRVVARHHIRTYEDMSAVSPETMQRVIRDVVEMYPNKSYGMILSGHATSWLPANVITLRAFGEENGKRMELRELAEGLPDKRFDFLIFDACSMAAVECVYELRNKADYIMASPSETMSYGIPYKTVLPFLFTEEANLEKAAESFYLFYKNDFAGAPYGNISVVKTSELEALALIAGEIISGTDISVVYTPPLPDWQLLSYWAGSPTALYDFADVIGRLATGEQYTRFNVCLNKTVIAAFATEYTYCSGNRSTVRVNRFSGFSLYPVQSQLPLLNEWYKQLQWSKDVYRPT